MSIPNTGRWLKPHIFHGKTFMPWTLNQVSYSQRRSNIYLGNLRSLPSFTNNKELVSFFMFENKNIKNHPTIDTNTNKEWIFHHIPILLVSWLRKLTQDINTHLLPFVDGDNKRVMVKTIHLGIESSYKKIIHLGTKLCMLQLTTELIQV